MQRYDKFGNTMGNNVQVNQIVLNTSQYPCTARQSNGKFIISWMEVIADTLWVLRYRLYSSIGEPISNFITVPISDTIFERGITNTAIACNGFGNYILIWEMISYWTTSKIYYQIIDTTGAFIGGIRKAGSPIGDPTEAGPEITVLPNNNFVVTWKDNRMFGQIFMQMFDPLGNKIGSDVRVNEDSSAMADKYYPNISSDSTGDFVISWGYIPNPYYTSFVLYQRYDKFGNKLGTNTQVFVGEANNSACVSKRKNGDFAIGMWVAETNNLELAYFQRVKKDGSVIGGPHYTSISHNYHQVYQDIALYGDRMISVWQDSRPSKPGMYCNILSFQNPDSTVGIIINENKIPIEYKLYQNYPNPYNPTTNIKYAIPKDGFVTIKIYDLLGREINKLVSENQKAGFYSVQFNGASLSSGIYFYRIQSGSFVQTKKMVLIK
jgi:hypothetical protein